MGDSDENLIKAINHYQSGLERYMERQDETKMLHNMGRLYKLPIKVAHLEKTGVGRTVNSLRKLEGEVGDAAKSLVAKWKDMVMQEEDKKVAASSPKEENEESEQCSEENHRASHETERNDLHNNENRHKNSSSHKKHESSKSKNHNEKDTRKHRDEEKSKKRKHSSSDENNDCDNSKNANSDSDNSERESKRRHHKEKKLHKSESSNHKKESSKKSKHSNENERDNHKHKKTDKHEKQESSEKKKHKHKSSQEENTRDRDKEKESRKQDCSKERPKSEKDKDHKDRKEHKNKKSKDEERIERDVSVSAGHSSKSQSSSETSTHYKKKDHDTSKKGSKRVSNLAVINGIGSDSGTSFADALGMCAPPLSKKKKSMSQPEKPREPSPETDENELPVEMPLPKEPLENLDINISTLLPSITPNYRPLGLPVTDQPKKILSDDEALSRVMMNKNQRTKVFSGNKVAWGKVPSLFDICVRILQDNIDALEYTGGVPYLILKPILEKATANQLYMMEHHNPYLIDDSDELWKLHCQKEFRNKSRDELETWRDMYMRCLDEREAKLRALTANIKQSQDKSIPVRTTKLAYVDSVAKPPRNIARKQAKNATFKERPSPSAKLVSLATKGEAAKVAVPNPGGRAVERSSSGSSHSLKPKKAPLMAKALSSFKNRFRR